MTVSSAAKGRQRARRPARAEVPAPRTPPEDEPSEEQADRVGAATRLVRIAQSLYELGVSEEGHVFGIPRRGPVVVQMLRGGKTSLRAQLARVYFDQTGRVASQQHLADALGVIEGIAQDTPERALNLRVAQQDGALWLDLGDLDGVAARVDHAGWSLHPAPPDTVLYRRTALNAALPRPVRGGTLNMLWDWLNVTETDRPLILSWLVSLLHQGIPHPILSLGGEQGTGKSTASRVLVSILDPSPVPIRKAPRDADAWVTAAAGSWVVGLDNLSVVPDWLSDSLCRAVTGDGDVRRKLYTDGDMVVFSFRRCLVMNGIDLGALRGDLAERLIPVTLDVIPEDKRVTETEMWPRWAEAHPMILGAVLDLAAQVQAVLPTVRLRRKPRLADFAVILAAVDKVMNTSGLDTFLERQNNTAREALTADPWIAALCEEIAAFEGTSAELLGRVPAPDVWSVPKGWPRTARQATAVLRRQAPVMRKAGWTVADDGGANKDGITRWTLVQPETARPGGQTGNDAPEQLVAVAASTAGHDVR